jgi:hypothetical protein
MRSHFIGGLFSGLILSGCVTDSPPSPQVSGRSVSLQEEAKDRAACRGEAESRIAANAPPPLANGEYDILKKRGCRPAQP